MARLLYFIVRWPVSIWRLILWIFWITSPGGKHSFIRWFCGLVLLSVDLMPFAFLYSTIMDIVKRQTRLMTKDEILAAQSVFGTSIPFRLVSLDPASRPVQKGRTAAYVSFFTINFDKAIRTPLLIHELTHVWQYHHFGSVYISEAIWAQRWGGGYNYGGLEPLQKYSDAKGLAAFNFEQQADIIEEYFRWKNGMPLQWITNVPGVGNVLEKYRSEVFQ